MRALIRGLRVLALLVAAPFLFLFALWLALSAPIGSGDRRGRQ